MGFLQGVLGLFSLSLFTPDSRCYAIAPINLVAGAVHDFVM